MAYLGRDMQAQVSASESPPESLAAKMFLGFGYA
jgi:hypothetical protein